MRVILFAMSLTISFAISAKECASQEAAEMSLATIKELDTKVQQAYLSGASLEAILSDQAAGYFKLWEAAADDGNASAQYLCGICSRLGIGTEKEHKQANEWFRKAAEQDHAAAMVNYGLSFGGGIGNKQDPVAKLKWLRKAQELGSTEAIGVIASCYFDGEGVPQDMEEAIRLFQVAADRGSGNAKHTLGICFINGMGVPADVEKGMSLITESASQGFAIAQNSLGAMHYMGRAVKINYAEAVKWFRMSAEQGNTLAQYHLALCYKEGDGVAKDLEEARGWFSKAADQGLQQAKDALDELGHSALETKYLLPLKSLIVEKIQAKQQSLQNMNLRAYEHATGGTGRSIGSIQADVRKESEAKYALENYLKKNKSGVLAALKRLSINQNDRIASEASQLIRSIDRPEAAQEKKR